MGAPTGKYRAEVMDFIRSLEGGWTARAAACTERFGVKYGGDAMRMHCIGHGLTLSDKVGVHPPPTFRKFMQSARTLSEIARKCGCTLEEALRAVNDTPADVECFERRDNWGDLLYSWLPVWDDKVEILPRAYKTSIHQPTYAQTVKLSDQCDEVLIIPLYDVHYGQLAHRRDKFIQTLEYIAETPHTYCFCGGDLMENALDDGRGMMYGQKEQPRTQVQDMTSALAKVAHKLLFMIPGNHEDRTYKRTGQDPTEFIARKLEVPYFDSAVCCSINWAGYTWNIEAAHGIGGAQTEGGQINSAMRNVSAFDGIHFNVTGHVHNPRCQPETRVHFDSRSLEMVEYTRWHVIAPSFLAYWGTYAHKARYRPPGKGGVGLHVCANGEYYASFTPAGRPIDRRGAGEGLAA